MVKQIECIALQLRFLSKLCFIVLAAPAPAPPCSQPLTSYTTAIVARPASCPTLPRRGCSCCPCKHRLAAGGCDWVSPPPLLPLLSSGTLSLLFFLICGAPCVPAFLTASLRLLPREGADASCKLVPSVSSPRIQTSHWSADRSWSDVVQ